MGHGHEGLHSRKALPLSLQMLLSPQMLGSMQGLSVPGVRGGLITLHQAVNIPVVSL